MATFVNKRTNDDSTCGSASVWWLAKITTFSFRLTRFTMLSTCSVPNNFDSSVIINGLIKSFPLFGCNCDCCGKKINSNEDFRKAAPFVIIERLSHSAVKGAKRRSSHRGSFDLCKQSENIILYNVFRGLCSCARSEYAKLRRSLDGETNH